MFNVAIHDVNNFVLLWCETYTIGVCFESSRCFFSTYKGPHCKVGHAWNALITHFHLQNTILWWVAATTKLTSFSCGMRSASSAAFAACCLKRFRSSWIIRWAAVSRCDSRLRYSISLINIELWPCCSINFDVAGAISFEAVCPGVKKFKRRYLQNIAIVFCARETKIWIRLNRILDHAYVKRHLWAINRGEQHLTLHIHIDLTWREVPRILPGRPIRVKL